MGNIASTHKPPRQALSLVNQRKAWLLAPPTCMRICSCIEPSLTPGAGAQAALRQELKLTASCGVLAVQLQTEGPSKSVANTRRKGVLHSCLSELCRTPFLLSGQKGEPMRRLHSSERESQGSIVQAPKENTREHCRGQKEEPKGVL